MTYLLDVIRHGFKCFGKLIRVASEAEEFTPGAEVSQAPVWAGPGFRSTSAPATAARAKVAQG